MTALTFTSLILLLAATQLRGQKQRFHLHRNAFDDQYICCAKSLENEIMPDLLKKEKESNTRFHGAWNKAEEKLRDLKDFLSQYDIDTTMFKDDYAVALILYSMDDLEVQPVLEQFEADVSSAGLSREEYMNKFNFKAFHFYLTKGLQEYSVKLTAKRHVFTTYHIPDNTTHVFRFGKFAKFTAEVSDVTLQVATSYYVYNTSSFQIPHSNETSKIIFPISETFFYVGNIEQHKYITSTGQKCSFYNCAYLAEEKNKSMSCSPESEWSGTCSSASRRTVLFQEIPHVFPGLILTVNAAFAKLVWAF